MKEIVVLINYLNYLWFV